MPKEHDNTQPVTQAVQQLVDWLRKRTKHLNIYIFFLPSLNGVLFPMFCLLVEEKCQILVF